MVNRILKFLLLVPALAVLSCVTAETPVTPPGSGSSRGAFIINEGAYPGPGTVSYYDRTGDSVDQNVVGTSANWVTPNDAKVVGNKLYVVVNGNAEIQILNAESFVHIGRIPTGSLPGFLSLIDTTRAVLANYNGTVCLIDIARDSVIRTSAPVVVFPGGIAAVNGKIFVSDLGYYVNPQNVVRVLDGTTLQTLDSIFVGTSPGMIVKGASSRCYVSCAGVWPGKGKVYALDAATDRVTDSVTVGVGPSDISLVNQFLYVLHADHVMRLASTPLSVMDSSFVTRGTGLYFYAMQADPGTG